MINSDMKAAKLIGYWMPEKKLQKLKMDELESVVRKYGYRLVKLNLNKSLEEQGPFCAILHKLTDVIVKSANGNLKCTAMLERVESYINSHPEVCVFDPLNNVQILLDRSRYYNIIQHSNLGKIDVFTPCFVELTSCDLEANIKKLYAAGVSFPFVCKPAVAHGSSDVHKMAIIFNENGIKDCKFPCVAQSFINHNAVLYKIYVIREKFCLIRRPSLKNFYPSDSESIFFDTYEVSKADSMSSLSILDPEDSGCIIATPDMKRFSHIVAVLGAELGLKLFGIDIVIENDSGRYGIIDINCFPSYDGFPNLFECLAECVCSIPFSEPSYLQFNSAPDMEDSGFDTGDSSDEKHKKRLR